MQEEGYQKISVSMPKVVFVAVQEYAKKNRYSVSGYITGAVEEDLRRRGALNEGSAEEALIELVRAAKDEGIDVELLLNGAMRQKKGAA